ncbi:MULTISPECIES: hypothetical protein [Moorena]|uniref:Uncharacterized protein n=1 Tax=Moorena producens 3L TaxID=489825 RepID=F4XLY2_9CYAN|nr:MULTISPECIES: hypothetical protein [Moorena]NEQ16874.1 hypothetical protein [Moorena sp. SIO3E2]EGJ34404.1 hypothetical protein LYNGBM3L_16830 [Moorena producens 3L]NEP36682.1 hypothetical protein [Moorena sp. SIO3B2]NEP66091.1 hypothetical protein [Moorena sp. SIO3A5]NER91979.1 hypothetical protein [Moorena sp. SIO3A2]
MEMMLKRFTLVIFASLCLFLGGGIQYSHAADLAGQVTLALPRTPAHDEAVRVRISAGVLPRRSSIVVRSMDGRILGTVSPFGVRPGQPSGVYTIPLPERVLKDGKVSLVLQLKQKGAKGVRAPSAEEFLGAELVYIPITPFD